MSSLIHVVHYSDTCADVQENAKITSAYVKHLSGLRDVFPVIDLVPISNTIDVGFNLSEAITNPEAAPRLLLTGNYAPPDKPSGTDDNIRKSFYAAKLEFGGQVIPIVTTLNGFELSYIKPAVTELYEIDSSNGSQFRSLTLAPRTNVHFSDDKLRQQLLDTGAIKRVSLQEIPNVPDVSHVVHVDNFRNVKIWFSEADREVLARIASKEGKADIKFLAASADPFSTIAADDPSVGASFSAAPRPSLFKASIGEKILAQRSSSFYVDGSNVQQLVELRQDPVKDLTSFPLPYVGQRVNIHPGGTH